MPKETAPEDPAGQEHTFESVINEYGAPLRRLAGAYEANIEQRRDLLQDIHIAIWRSLAIFRDQCSLRTWIYRVAHNTASTHCARDRGRARRHLYSLEEIAEMIDPHDTEAVTDRTQVLQRLRELIRRLQVPDRQIILLYLEDMDSASIGAIVGLAPGNVATKIHRIKALLARRFHAEESRDA